MEATVKSMGSGDHSDDNDDFEVVSSTSPHPSLSIIDNHPTDSIKSTKNQPATLQSVSKTVVMENDDELYMKIRKENESLRDGLMEQHKLISTFESKLAEKEEQFKKQVKILILDSCVAVCVTEMVLQKC